VVLAPLGVPVPLSVAVVPVTRVAAVVVTPGAVARVVNCTMLPNVVPTPLAAIAQ
jgi:hypothetical protein